ncbi:hypothetical protein B0H10DRAFT_762857 [Mycena sp. CBHHK59/15]|nr:hypothetical protein B0H10DRAFT_762857 [Mycena sp. CBHHK59/15]
MLDTTPSKLDIDDVVMGLQHRGGHRSITILSSGDAMGRCQFELFFPHMQKAAPHLETLVLENRPKFNCLPGFAQGHCAFDPSLFGHTTPALRHLRLHDFRDAWSYPLAQNLTVMDLSEKYFRVFVPPLHLTTVLARLRQSPRLEVLCLAGRMLPECVGSPGPEALFPEHIVALPRLRELHLDENATICYCLRSTLICPWVSQLALPLCADRERRLRMNSRWQTCWPILTRSVPNKSQSNRWMWL